MLQREEGLLLVGVKFWDGGFAISAPRLLGFNALWFLGLKPSRLPEVVAKESTVGVFCHFFVFRVLVA